MRDKNARFEIKLCEIRDKNARSKIKVPDKKCEMKMGDKKWEARDRVLVNTRPRAIVT